MGATSVVFNLIFMVIGAVLSVLIAKLIRQNGRVLEKMDEGFRIIAGLISAESESTKKRMVEDLRKGR